CCCSSTTTAGYGLSVTRNEIRGRRARSAFDSTVVKHPRRTHHGPRRLLAEQRGIKDTILEILARHIAMVGTRACKLPRIAGPLHPPICPAPEEMRRDLNVVPLVAGQ